jgi:hypothetical protein
LSPYWQGKLSLFTEKTPLNGARGELFLTPFAFDHGNYKKNYVDTVALAVFPVKEMGHREAVNAALKLLEEKEKYCEENGAIYYNCSN